MTSDQLQKEAREAAEVYAKKCWPQRPSVGDTAERRSLMSDVHHAGESGFEDGYLAAAELREKEIEGLWAEKAGLLAQVADLTETVERLNWTLERPEERS